MNAKQTKKLIDHVGGDVAFAELLGIADRPGFHQRVNNWKRRGLPDSVALEHYDTIKGLEQEFDRQRSESRPSA